MVFTPQWKNSDTDGFLIVQNENLIQDKKGKAEKRTVPLEVMASVNSKKIIGQNSNVHCVNSNYGEKILRCYIIGAGNDKV